jgi:hypothetical protein
VWPKGLGKFKKIIHLIGSRTRGLRYGVALVPDCTESCKIVILIDYVMRHSILTNGSANHVAISTGSFDIKQHVQLI